MEEAADQAADDGYHTGRLGGPGPGDEELSGALAQGKVQPRGPETHGPTKNNQHVLLDPLFAPPYNVACTGSLFLAPQVQTANISSARTIAPPHLDVGRNPFPTFIHHRHLDRTPHVHSLLSLLSGQSPTRSCKTSLTMSHDKTGSDRAWRD